MYRVPQRSDPRRRRPASLRAGAILIAAAILLPLPLDAQVVRVARAENLRIEPNGALIGTLEPGVELRLIETRDTWVQAEIEGWVWARSLQVADQGELDVVVSLEGGENLRERPQGPALAFLQEGAFLEELERIPGWILVRRRGWIWRASIEIDESVTLPATIERIGSEGPPASAGPTTAAPTTAAPDPAAGEQAESSGAASSTAGGPAGTAVDSVGASAVRPFTIDPGTVVRRAPDGDTLTVVEEPGRVAVVGSEGGWARVLIEGWVRLPEGMQVALSAAGAMSDGAGGLSLADVVANPAVATGALVAWELQFISLERASPGRPEFTEGEAYLLMRPATEGTGRFVYVVVPESAVEAAEEFVPLERLEVRGRVRTGASAVTGGPVLELVEMTRRR